MAVTKKIGLRARKIQKDPYTKINITIDNKQINKKILKENKNQTLQNMKNFTLKIIGLHYLDK